MTPSRTQDGATRGYIVPIGGAEDKSGAEDILKRFVSLCGGRRAKVVVIPTASEVRNTGRNYEKLFRDLRASRVDVLDFETRDDCDDREALDTIAEADGVFLTGGNQLRLSTTLGGTPVARALRRRNAAGTHIAGTSAGAAFLSEHMIAFGQEGATPRNHMVALAPGLGLTNRVIVDQHFRQRDRLGRLLTAMAYNPFAVGLGLDEDTAVFIGPDDTMEVVGSGALTIVDPSGLEFSSVGAARNGDPVCLVGVRLHILIEGAKFDLRSLQVTAPRLEREER